MSGSAKNRIESAIEAGKQIQSSIVHGESEKLSPFIVLPNGVVQSLEQFAEKPRRHRGRITLRDADSFVQYVNRFASPQSVIFADSSPDKLTFTAVIDYHEPDGDAAWWDHQARLQLVPTEAWKRWQAKNGQKMTQVEMAQFLEDHIPDIAQPSGALIVEIARTLESKKAVDFKSEVRLQDGQHQILYAETINNVAKNGSVQIPETFTLGIQPFEGSAKYALEVRFRFRINGTTLVMWYDLLRPEDMVRDAFNQTREVVEKALEQDITMLLAQEPKGNGLA
jgi:uncharacterized protein YfdQ (DUF2303 family)